MDVTAPIPTLERQPDPGRAQVLQWIGIFLPAAAFFAHLEVGYVLVPRACRTGHATWIHIVATAAVLLSAAGALAAWRTWSSTNGSIATAGPRPRTRFLGVVGLGMGLVFTLILLAQWISSFVLRPCQ